METQLVFGLYSFISYANQLSEENKDEDYILREAVTTLDLLGKRLSYLYPSYEGVFDIKTFCVPDAKQCGQGDLGADRLTFLNSITDLGIFSGLFNNRNGEQHFMFYRTVIESFGTRLYTVSEILSTSGRPSELYVKLDDKQNIKGYVVSSRYPGTLRFEGTPLYSPIKFYVDEGVEQAKPIITGKFEGLMGDKKASIIIRQKKNKALIASMQVGNLSNGMTFDFTNGEFIEHRGIINLVGFPGQKVEPSKINIAYRKNANGEYRWTGGYFSISGKYTKIEFKRSAEIDQPNPDERKDLL